ncbi:MAG: DegT/DnrJ/EryC1/StrS family aminotransferase [Nitrososphaerales archaeon]
MIPISLPFLKREEQRAVAKVLARGSILTNGPLVETFEKEVARLIRVRYAVAVSSGTAALHLALLACGIGPSDEVIVPAYTFPASANAVALTGAKPILCDIETRTFNIDPRLILPLITSKVRAILPVHLFGLPAKMDEITYLCRRFNLHLIEDAACALGATFKGRMVGSFGLVSCFSFHPRKVITCGEGGMIVTNHRPLAEIVRSLRDHGKEMRNARMDFVVPGFNYKLSEIHAALGLAQLKRLSRLIFLRRLCASRYHKALGDLPGIQLPRETEGYLHTYQSYVIYCDSPRLAKKIIAGMQSQGVESLFGTYALPGLSYYRKPGLDLNQSKKAQSCSVTLPLYPGMKRKDFDRVVSSLRRIVQGG